MSATGDIETNESQRLLQDVPATTYGSSSAVGAAADDLAAPITYDDENAVDFDENDPENPINWPKWYKWTIMSLLTGMMIIDVVATMSIVPAVPELMKEFGETNSLFLPLVVSIWELGEGVGPFVVAPMAEMFGRMPVYHIGNFFFLAFSALSAMSTNIRMLVAFRFLTGFSIPVLTVMPSVIGDLFVTEERGFAMAVCMFSTMLGLSGPLVGGWVAETKGWRWTIWVIVIAIGILEIISLFVLPETYKITILRRKAKRLRKETGNEELHSKYEIANQKDVIKQNLLRPTRMLFLEPIVCFVSWYAAIEYGMAYANATMIVTSYQKEYGFSPVQTSLVFIGGAVGNVIGTFIYGGLSDRYVSYIKKKEGVLRAESRLIFLLFGGIIFPIGFIIYGWSLQWHMHWIVPTLGIVVLSLGGTLVGASQQGYLIDAYDTYSASAMAASVISKAVLGAIIPLASPSLNGEWLNYGWGNSVFGFVGLFFVPFIILLIKYGERVRKTRRGSISKM